MQPALQALMCSLLYQSREYCCAHLMSFKDPVLLLHSASQPKLHFQAILVITHLQNMDIARSDVKIRLNKAVTVSYLLVFAFCILFRHL